MKVPNLQQITTLEKKFLADVELAGNTELSGRGWKVEEKYQRGSRNFEILLGGKPYKEPKSPQIISSMRSKSEYLDATNNYAMIKLSTDEKTGNTLYTYAVNSFSSIYKATTDDRIKKYSLTMDADRTHPMWINLEEDESNLLETLGTAQRFAFFEKSLLDSVVETVWTFYIFRLEVENLNGEIVSLFFLKKYDPCHAARTKWFSVQLKSEETSFGLNSNPFLMFNSNYDIVVAPSLEGMWVLNMATYDELAGARLFQRSGSSAVKKALIEGLGLNDHDLNIIIDKIKKDKNAAKTACYIAENPEVVGSGKILYDNLCKSKDIFNWNSTELKLVDEHVVVNFKENRKPTIKEVNELLLTLCERTYTGTYSGNHYSSAKSEVTLKDSNAKSNSAEQRVQKISSEKDRIRNIEPIPKEQIIQGTLFDYNDLPTPK